MNGRIHTQDKDLPWAESLVTRDDRIVLVGSVRGRPAVRWSGRQARRPAGPIRDAGDNRRAHPPRLDQHLGRLSGLDETAGENEEPATPDRMPSRPREATLAWLQQYADDHPFTLVITQAAWDVAAYLPDGPHRRDLDEISSVRPILLYDNSGHSFWVNSAMLRSLGIDRNTPDLSENLSYFVRDETGEPTGGMRIVRSSPGQPLTGYRFAAHRPRLWRWPRWRGFSPRRFRTDSLPGR